MYHRSARSLLGYLYKREHAITRALLYVKPTELSVWLCLAVPQLHTTITGPFPFQLQFADRFRRSDAAVVVEVEAIKDEIENSGYCSQQRTGLRREKYESTLSIITNMVNSANGSSRILQNIAKLLRNAETVTWILQETGCRGSAVNSNEKIKRGTAAGAVLCNPGAPAEHVTLQEVFTNRVHLVHAKEKEKIEKAKAKELKEKDRQVHKQHAQDRKKRKNAFQESKKRLRDGALRVAEVERQQKKKRRIEALELARIKKIVEKKLRAEIKKWTVVLTRDAYLHYVLCAKQDRGALRKKESLRTPRKSAI